VRVVHGDRDALVARLKSDEALEDFIAFMSRQKGSLVPASSSKSRATDMRGYVTPASAA
jgi:hypothetical protein